MEQADALAVLEQKIMRAAELVAQLRQERDSALEAAGEAQTLRNRLGEVTRELETAKAERDALRADKDVVRKRLEKLLDQIDAIGTS